MANPHISYEVFKSRFGDLGITEWTKYNYLSNYNFGLPAQTEVPSEYLELESISGKSTTYIKIPFQFVSSNFRIELDSAITETADRTALSFVSPTYYSLAYGRGFSGKIFGTNNNIVEDGYLVWYNTSKEKLHAVITHTTYTVDGANYNEIGSTGTFPSYTEVRNLLLFKIQESSSTGGDGITIYKLVVYDNNQIVLNLKPVKRLSDGAVGMYDTVTNSFFGNAGTGTFTAGPMKQRYVRVEYVQNNNGNDYIDTGINIKNGRIEGKMAVIDHPGTDWTYLCGAQSSTAGNRKQCMVAGCRQGKFAFYHGQVGIEDAGTALTTGTNFTISATVSKPLTAIYNGVITNSALSATSDIVNHNIYIFALNLDSTITYSPAGYIRLYAFKMYNGNNLLRNFVPVYDLVSEKYGLYDMVESKFYGSANGLLTGPWDFVNLGMSWQASQSTPHGYWTKREDTPDYDRSKLNEFWLFNANGYRYIGGVQTGSADCQDHEIAVQITTVTNEFYVRDNSADTTTDIANHLSGTYLAYHAAE